jgi:hypothetical protein
MYLFVFAGCALFIVGLFVVLDYIAWSETLGWLLMILGIVLCLLPPVRGRRPL